MSKNYSHISPVEERIKELNPNALLMPEYADALIGFSTRNSGEIVAVYSTQTILRCLMEQFQCDYWDAVDYYDYNIDGTKLNNPNAPIVVELIDRGDGLTESYSHEDQSPIISPGDSE